MKQQINYYYGMYIDKIYNKSYFFYNDIKYYIYKCNKENIYKLVNELKNINTVINELVLTKNNDYVFNYKNENYVLIKVNYYEKQELTLDDIVKRSLKVNSKVLVNNEYDTLCDIVDKNEEKFLGYTYEYEKIKDIFNYYVGLGENIISYLDDSLTLFNSEYYLSIKELNTNTYKDLIDISNIEYNYKTKIIGRYINNKIINMEDYYEELEYYFNSCNLTEFDYRIIYCESLFPFYFFKLFDEEIDEKEIVKLYKNIKYYEHQYINLYNLICKYTKIPDIWWIKL